MAKYFKYLGFLLAGAFITTVYFTDHKAEYINMFAVRLYMKTDIGRESMRMQLLSDCHQAGFALELDQHVKFDAIKFKYETCKREAEESLKWLEQGQFPAQL